MISSLQPLQSSLQQRDSSDIRSVLSWRPSGLDCLASVPVSIGCQVPAPKLEGGSLYGQ